MWNYDYGEIRYNDKVYGMTMGVDGYNNVEHKIIGGESSETGKLGIWRIMYVYIEISKN